MKAILGRLMGRAASVASAISLKWLWLAIVALATLVGVQSCRLQDAREDVGQAEARFQNALQAAINNEQTAFDLAARLRAEVERNKADAAAQEKANQTLEDRLAAIQKQSQDERAARDEIYATDQDCSDWRAAPVCPAIAGRLRGDPAADSDDD